MRRGSQRHCEANLAQALASLRRKLSIAGTSEEGLGNICTDDLAAFEYRLGRQESLSSSRSCSCKNAYVLTLFVVKAANCQTRLDLPLLHVVSLDPLPLQHPARVNGVTR